VEGGGFFGAVLDLGPRDFQAHEKLQTVRAKHGQADEQFGQLGGTIFNTHTSVY